MKPWPYPRIIAHRGGGTLAPENTLAGMRKAKQLGFAGVEFDVVLAGDATPILMHDETLARTTSGSGAIAATAYRDMLTLDAGSWFSAQHAGEPVPSFEQAGPLVRGTRAWADIEIKPSKDSKRRPAPAAARAARELWRGAAVQPLLCSFQPAALAAAREAVPELPRGGSTQTIPADWKHWMQSSAACRCTATTACCCRSRRARCARRATGCCATPSTTRRLRACCSIGASTRLSPTGWT